MKKIVLFADGTGNAFTTQESNVWRLYQALDQSAPDQVAVYIQGVGTSGFRPLAALDSATGFGVPSNVRKLYRFLCWNWEPGDEIYMFGFSRGAFTIRTLVGLMHWQGLVPREIDNAYVSRDEMDRNIMSAWRQYRSQTVPLRETWPTIWIARGLRDAALTIYRRGLRHRTYRSVQEGTVAQGRKPISVKFVGLFDTVEAYGVPIEELRQAIDRVIWPISFRNRKLSGTVENARHALALDDERTAFHPLRFDMSDEGKPARPSDPPPPPRIKEVWFAGVHSDVGGGYPDAAAALVPLAWMAEEAEMATADAAGRRVPAGLRFIPEVIEEFRDKASPLGPLHDSRRGLSVLYRYNPRPIHEDETSGGPPVIHHSVAEKMTSGTDRYAPITLPGSALVLMPDGSPYKIAGFSAHAAAAAPAGRPMTDQTAKSVQPARDAVHTLNQPNEDFVELTRDTVWWRRVAYVALLLAFLLVASLPKTAIWITEMFGKVMVWLFGLVGLPRAGAAFWDWLGGVNAGVAANVGRASGAVGGLLPGFLRAWLDIIVLRPLTCGVIILIALLLYAWNGRLRNRIADYARCAWFLNAQTPVVQRAWKARGKRGPLTWFARVMRKSRALRHLLHGTTRFALPALALLAVAAGALILANRVTVGYRAAAGNYCIPTDAKVLTSPAEGTAHAIPQRFDAGSRCWASGVRLEKGRTYTLWMDMTEPFFDRTIMTGLAGFKGASPLWLPLLRWPSADWFQPVARIGHVGTAEWPLKAADAAAPMPATRFELDSKTPFGNCAKMPEAVLPQARDAWSKHKEEDGQSLRSSFVSQFVASETGELYLFVNDVLAAVPFGPDLTCFYDNNTGQAKVTIELAPAPKPRPAAQP